MKLKSIEVHKFRSITVTQRLQLEDGLTVILGPNNEGKSNLLKAIVLAMECLRFVRLSPPTKRQREPGRFRLMRGVYDWETDFPQQLQEKQPNGETKLILEFELNDADKAGFKRACKSTINADLTLEISIDARSVGIKVKNKRGLGATSINKKSIEIARFVASRFDFQYIPAIRPTELSLRVISSLIERELGALEGDEEYLRALQTITELQRPIFERLSGDVQRYLKQLLPSVKAVQLGNNTSLGRTDFGSRIRLPQFMIDDGTATDLEAKGDGIKSLVAISLMRASKTGGASGDLVVAIEEPESHLHPGAVRGLSQVLHEMSAEHQVIITTHSPLLAARVKLQSNIIVSRSKAVPAKSINQVREALGVQVEDNLQSAEYVLVVEGKHDVSSLRAIFCQRSKVFADFIEKGRLVLDDLEGASKIGYKLTTLRLQVAQPILLIDDDGKGRETVKKAKLDGGLEEKFIFQWKRPLGMSTELEDIFNPDSYWGKLQAECGVTLDKPQFLAKEGDWSTRMKEMFEQSGKTWNSSVESNAKKAVAEAVAASPELAVDEHFETQVDNIISSMCNLIASP